MEEALLLALRLFVTMLWGVLDGLLYWPFDFGYESASDRFSRWVVLVGYFIIGCAVGWLSLHLFPHVWLSHPSLRIANLIVSPMVAGSVGVFSARQFYRVCPDVEPRDHFLPGFLFALAVAAIRFAYIERPI